MSDYYHNDSHRHSQHQQQQQQQHQYGRGQGNQYYQQQTYEYQQDRQQQQQHRHGLGRHYGNEQFDNADDRPVTTQEQQGPPYRSTDLPPLPPGWVEAKDPSTGRIYYANPHTQETQWERPSLPQPPPPPQLNLPRPPLQYAAQNQNINVTNSDSQNVSSDVFNRQASTAPTPIVAVAANWTTTPTRMPEENNIVTRSREMLIDDRPSNNRSSTSVTDGNLELYSLSGGEIADLSKLQNRCWQDHIDETKKKKKISTKDGFKDDEDDKNEKNSRHLPPYTPIHPYLLPSSSMEISRLVEKVEPGRIDVRIHSLKQELVKYGYTASSTR